ncbi:MAG: DUF2971 domain-containing protein [Rhodothermales bacterium]
MAYRSQPLYLLKPAYNTPEIENAMNGFIASWLDLHQLSDAQRLYHYTDLAGLRGILASRSLWFSHATSLNDPLEIQYGQDLIADALNSAMAAESNDEARTFLRQITVQVQAFGRALFHSFVACFCEDDDLLSQWRGYADRGGGYCIGFEFSDATRTTSSLDSLDKGRSPFLRKVIYDEDGQRKLASDYIQQVTDAAKAALATGISKAYGSMPGYVPSVMAMQAANVLLDMMLVFKHRAFREEKEWRLIRVTMDNHEPESIQFREAYGGLAPFRPTHVYDLGAEDAASFPLRAISFGPSLEPLRTRAALELLVHHTGSDESPIGLTPHLVQIKGPGYSLR